MNTISPAASTHTILAIDLGNYKSVACPTSVLDPTGGFIPILTAPASARTAQTTDFALTCPWVRLSLKLIHVAFGLTVASGTIPTPPLPGDPQPAEAQAGTPLGSQEH